MKRGKNVKPIETVGAKPLLFDHALQIAIRGGDHARIGVECARIAQAFKLALLQNSKQLRLEFEGKFLKSFGTLPKTDTRAQSTCDYEYIECSRQRPGVGVSEGTPPSELTNLSVERLAWH